MKRRYAAFFLAMLVSLPLCLPSSLAETQTWQFSPNAIQTATVTTFEEDIPDVLRQALDAGGYMEYESYCGAMIEWAAKKSSHSAHDQNTALIAVEKNGARTLLGLMLYDAAPDPITDLGEKSLLQNRPFRISVTGEDKLTSRAFVIVYPRAEGGEERYEIWYSPQWMVRGYRAEDANGAGVQITSQYSENGFRVHALPSAPENPALDYMPEEDSTYYTAYVPLWLERMDSITDYPTSEADAIRIANDSWMPFAQGGLAMLSGVNLREKPTTSSKSLGMYNAGTLVHVLGEQPGLHAPWYHVQVGHVEGYVSGVYLHYPQTSGFDIALWSGPLPIVRADDPLVLRQSPNMQSQAITEFPAATRMHVLTETNGWYHVIAPEGALPWNMDVNGTSGYVLKESVTLE